MKVVVDRIGASVAIVDVKGEIDAHTAGDLDGRLFDLLKGKRSRLIIGLAGVTYISSAGLGAVWRAYQEAGRRGGEVCLYGVPERVSKVFAMAGLDQVIPSARSREEALARWAE